MNVKLVVSSGKSAGRAISLKRATLLIGRAEECDVRPLSEDVSRRHCAVHVGPEDVFVEDLGSRNGTFVNGSRITGKVKVVNGDMLRVGALELKISCAAPAASGSDEDVSRWLAADDSPAGMLDTTQTIRPVVTSSPAPTPEPAAEAPAESGSTTTKLTLDALKAAKSSPGMLPAAPKKDNDSSRDAAAEALKKFFNNR